jgi:predicted outer membrane lipoprotein
MLVGAALSAWCRPELVRSTVLGGLVFLLYYVAFLVGLKLTAPSGYIDAVWNLDHLSGIVFGFMPLEELLFAAAFGSYWASAYEHFTWRSPEPRDAREA